MMKTIVAYSAVEFDKMVNAEVQTMKNDGFSVFVFPPVICSPGDGRDIVFVCFIKTEKAFTK